MFARATRGSARTAIARKVDSVHECYKTRITTIRSSAVAERPRDASCLSVVRFNSTIPRAQSFIINYVGFRFINAYNLILFCCLQLNVEPFRHKQDALMRGAAAFAYRGRNRDFCPNLGVPVGKLPYNV